VLPPNALSPGGSDLDENPFEFEFPEEDDEEALTNFAIFGSDLGGNPFEAEFPEEDDDEALTNVAIFGSDLVENPFEAEFSAEREESLINAWEQALSVHGLEIDLDEDGPLREEYLSKRPIIAAGSTRSFNSHQGPPVHTVDTAQNWQSHKTGERWLPPPALWNPAADEPILRERSGPYVAVQPPHLRSLRPPFFSPSVPFR
jgi:hypothetical protein